MDQIAILAAIRKRTPDSIAPDGAPLKHVLRYIEHFSQNEREVIRERRFGWEQASCKLLAEIFCTTPQTIARICNEREAS